MELDERRSPQEGQDGVDLGGWSFAVDDLSSKGHESFALSFFAGYARLEFLSGSLSKDIK